MKVLTVGRRAPRVTGAALAQRMLRKYGTLEDARDALEHFRSSPTPAERALMDEALHELDVWALSRGIDRYIGMGVAS
jgi:hypothetical protein